MSIDPSVRAGDILTLILFTVGGLGFLWSMRGELKMLSRDVKSQGSKIENLQTVLTAIAVQDQRLNDFGRQLDELRHWKGFVNPNGEYDRAGKVKSVP